MKMKMVRSTTKLPISLKDLEIFKMMIYKLRHLRAILKIRRNLRARSVVSALCTDELFCVVRMRSTIDIRMTKASKKLYLSMR